MSDVRRGDLFAVGPHRIMCGDLEQGDALLLLDHLPIAPTLAWCDPPYDMRVARMFRRCAGDQREPQLDVLLLRLCEALSRVGGPAFIEMGVNGEALTNMALSQSGADYLVHRDCTYGKGKTRLLIYEARWEPGAPMIAPQGDSWEPAEGVFDATSQRVIFDPCMGVAGFGVRAIKRYHVYAGMELQPGRVDKALAKLGKLTGSPAAYLGNVIDTRE